MTPRKPLEQRVDDLELQFTDLADRQTRLERLMDKVRRDQRETRRQIDNVRQMVERVPAAVKQQLDAQTGEFRAIVAESETRNADRITSVARQWPAGAIVLASLLGSALAAVIVDALLIAFHGPHVG